MRQGHQNKRGRGRARKNTNPLSRNYESNGPDVKIRGSASHIAEKYASLARDAQSSSDPVSAENYWQHAEHYYRIIQTAEAQVQAKSQNNNNQNTANNNGGQKRNSDDARGNRHNNRNGNAAPTSGEPTQNAPENAQTAADAINGNTDAKPARRGPRTSKKTATDKSDTAQTAEAATVETAPAKKSTRKAAPKSEPKSAANPAEKNAPPEDVSA